MTAAVDEDLTRNRRDGEEMFLLLFFSAAQKQLQKMVNLLWDVKTSANISEIKWSEETRTKKRPEILQKGLLFVTNAVKIRGPH